MTRWIMALSVLGWTACSGELARIDVDFKDRTTVEGGGLLTQLTGTLGFDGFTQMNLIDSQELQNQGVEPGDISSAKLTTFRMTVISPDDGDLSFIESMDVLVGGPNLDEVQIASQDTFPPGQQVVDFVLPGTDLTDYVVSESMTLTTDVTGNLPQRDTLIGAYVVLTVGATLQGAINQARAEDD